MENKVEIGLYSVVCVTSDEVVDYGLPFCAIDDRAACGMVKEALTKDGLSDRIDITSFQVKKIGCFYPSSEFYPLAAFDPVMVISCVDLVEGGDESEREEV